MGFAHRNQALSMRKTHERALLFPPRVKGGLGGGGPVSVECTREECLARSIDEVGGVCAASPARQAFRFRTSLLANGEYIDDAEVLWPTPP
jgi:hypothetical protein